MELVVGGIIAKTSAYAHAVVSVAFAHCYSFAPAIWALFVKSPGTSVTLIKYSCDPYWPVLSVTTVFAVPVAVLLLLTRLTFTPLASTLPDSTSVKVTVEFATESPTGFGSGDARAKGQLRGRAAAPRCHGQGRPDVGNVALSRLERQCEACRGARRGVDVVIRRVSGVECLRRVGHTLRLIGHRALGAVARVCRQRAGSARRGKDALCPTVLSTRTVPPGGDFVP